MRIYYAQTLCDACLLWWQDLRYAIDRISIEATSRPGKSTSSSLSLSLNLSPLPFPMASNEKCQLLLTFSLFLLLQICHEKDKQIFNIFTKSFSLRKLERNRHRHRRRRRSKLTWNEFICKWLGENSEYDKCGPFPASFCFFWSFS